MTIAVFSDRRTKMGIFGSKKNNMVLEVANMNCEHCEKKVETALSFVPGVVSCKPNSSGKEVTVVLDSKSPAGVEAMVVALKEIGYEAKARV